MRSQSAACSAALLSTCGPLTAPPASGADDEPDPPLPLGELSSTARFGRLFLNLAITRRSGCVSKESPGLDDYAHPECCDKFEASHPLCDGSSARDLRRNPMVATALGETRLGRRARLSG